MVTAMEDEKENGKDVAVMDNIVSAEIDKQIATANAYPRSISGFKKTAMEMATLDEETAESCFYVLPRSNKSIEGPGVRLAEIVASAWKNMRVEAKQIGDVQPGDKFVTVRGSAWDMQTNVAWSIEVKRRIVDKYGKQYNEDMIGVTTNAACAIAGRNAVFKVVPSAYWKTIYEKCLEIVKGDLETLADRRAAALAHFQKLGVPQDKVFAALDVKDAEDITLDHLVKLRGLATALKEGTTTLDEVFPKPDVPTMPAKKSEKRDDSKPSGERDLSCASPSIPSDAGRRGQDGDAPKGGKGESKAAGSGVDGPTETDDKDSQKKTSKVKEEKVDPLKVKLDKLREFVKGPIEAIRDTTNEQLGEMCKGLKGQEFADLLMEYTMRKADLK